MENHDERIDIATKLANRMNEIRGSSFFGEKEIKILADAGEGQLPLSILRLRLDEAMEMTPEKYEEWLNNNIPDYAR